MSVTLLRADARCLPLASESVDLVVTSPPYFALRSYQDGGEHYAGQIGDEPTPQEFVASLLEVTRECVRVLKPSGSLWVNLGDKYATYAGNRSKGRTSLQGSTDRCRPVVARKGGLDGGGVVPVKSLMGIPWRYAIACVDDLDLVLRAEVIWSKPNGLPESVTDRVRRSHEQWFHFTREPRYYADVDPIREARSWTPTPGYQGHVKQRATGDQPVHQFTGGAGRPTDHPAGKLPNSVWSIPTQPLRVPESLGVDHYAAFPTEWPRRIISGWCPPGGTVLDPFGGTGTTAMVADVLGRHGVSVDRSGDYCRIAAWRTTDRNQRARVLRKPPAPAIEPPDADTLW